MAKKPLKKAPPPKASGGVNKIALMMIAAAVVPFSLPTVTVLAVTMLPTVAAYFSERGSNRYAWLCVGGLNFAGVIPYLFGLWFGVHNLDEALRLLSDATVLLWAYGASMFGWIIYKAMPPMVGGWLSMTSARRISALKAAQRKLVEDWGDEVAKKSGGGGGSARGRDED
jgi:hypothetical protein